MLVDLVRGTLLVLSHSISLYIFSEPKAAIRRPWLFWLGITAAAELILVVLLGLYGYVFGMAGIAYVLLILLYLYAFIHASDWEVLRSLFVFFLYAAFFILSASIANFIGKSFFGNSGIVMAAIRNSLSAALIAIYPFLIKKPLLKIVRRGGVFKGWGSLVVFEVFACLMISITAFLGTFFISDAWLYSAILIFMLLFLISAFSVVIRTIGLMNEMSSRKAVEVQNAILANELEAEKALVDSAKSFRHDLRRHCAVVSSYIEEGRTEDALDYLSDLSGSVEKSSAARYTGNAVVNALLTMTARRIVSAGGVFSFDAVLSEDIDIPRPDLAVVFGNLLENAYEAAIRSSHPSVSVYARVKGSALHGEIVNTMEGEMKMSGSLPRSTKRDGGIGLRNVESVLSSHGGMLDIGWGGGTFAARFIIPLGNPSGNDV